MVSSFLLAVVTTISFQGAPAQTASGLRPVDLSPPVSTRPLTPEFRGDIQMARKMFREAIDTYKEGPANSAVIANKIGIAYHQLLDLDMARKQYERAIKLDPKYPEAINNLGTIYYAEKSYRRAVNQYKKALQLSPTSASIWSNLGTAYFARKNYDEGFVSYQKALEFDPDVFEHREGHGGVLLQERGFEERAKVHYYMAKTYAKAGARDRALIYIRKALEEGFNDRDKFKKEPEFAALRDDPEFKQLMAMEPKVL